MKAVLPRIERLYEDEVQRWRAAWERFFEDFWRPLLPDERRAYLDFEARWGDPELEEPINRILRRWFDEAEVPETDEDEYEAFVEAFDAALPGKLDTVDLALWPDGVPAPPERHPNEYQLTRICRRDKGAGEIERLAAGFLLFHLAMVRACEMYHGRTTYPT